MIRFLLWAIFLYAGSTCIPAFGQEQKQPKDSVGGAEWVINPRLNSVGHFPYTGALINRNVNFDLNVFFEYKRYGFFIFESRDLEDPHSIVNYLQPGIFKRFQLSGQFYVRLFFGYVFSQTSGFRDNDSDYYTAAVGYWTIADNLKLEYTALFLDLSQSGKMANRVVLSWFVKNFKIDLYVWHRILLEQGIHATSSSVAVNFPTIRLSNSVSIQNTLSYQGYITDTKPGFARRDGFLFSVAFPLAMRAGGSN